MTGRPPNTPVLRTATIRLDKNLSGPLRPQTGQSLGSEPRGGRRRVASFEAEDPDRDGKQRATDESDRRHQEIE